MLRHQDRLDRVVAVPPTACARAHAASRRAGKPLREAHDALGAAQAIEGRSPSSVWVNDRTGGPVSVARSDSRPASARGGGPLAGGR